MCKNSGDNIKELRLQCGFSLKKAAELSGIPEKLIEEIESGRNDVKIKTVFKLLEIYDAEIVFPRRVNNKADLI